jgi:hypothetical protein
VISVVGAQSTYIVYLEFLSVNRIGPPLPHPQASESPLPLVPGRETHSLVVEGVEGPNSDEGTVRTAGEKAKHSVYSTLWIGGLGPGGGGG